MWSARAQKAAGDSSISVAERWGSFGPGRWCFQTGSHVHETKCLKKVVIFELRKGTSGGSFIRNAWTWVIHERLLFASIFISLPVYLSYLHVYHADPSSSCWRNLSNIKQKPEETEKTQVLTALLLLFSWTILLLRGKNRLEVIWQVSYLYLVSSHGISVIYISNSMHSGAPDIHYLLEM